MKKLTKKRVLYIVLIIILILTLTSCQDITGVFKNTDILVSEMTKKELMFTVLLMVFAGNIIS